MKKQDYKIPIAKVVAVDATKRICEGSIPSMIIDDDSSIRPIYDGIDDL